MLLSCANHHVACFSKKKKKWSRLENFSYNVIVATQMCMRPQEPLWVLIWVKKLPAAMPLRSVPHPAAKLHLNHAADFDRCPNMWFSFVHLTLPDVFQVVSLRKEVAERFRWQEIFFSGLKLCNNPSVRLCFQQLGTCCIRLYPVRRWIHI